MKKSDKEKYVFSGYGITFDSAVSWSFDNGTAKNLVIFVMIIVHHLMHHCKNEFFVLGEEPTFRINWRFGLAEKHFSIGFSKANTKFSLSLHYNAGISFLFVNGK